MRHRSIPLLVLLLAHLAAYCQPATDPAASLSGPRPHRRERGYVMARVAPVVMVERHRERPGHNDWTGLSHTRSYAYEFAGRWGLEAGGLLDIGRKKGIVGLRLGATVGLRAMRYDWSMRSASIYGGRTWSYAHVDDLLATMAFSARLRFRTLGSSPFVFHVGVYGGFATPVIRKSYLVGWHYPEPRLPERPVYGAGYLLGLSKQFTVGHTMLEPILEGHLGAVRVTQSPALYSVGCSLGMVFWLGVGW